MGGKLPLLVHCQAKRDAAVNAPKQTKKTAPNMPSKNRQLEDGTGRPKKDGRLRFRHP